MLSQSAKRYIPLLAWIVVLSVIILIPLKIISEGFLPNDDALRHAAKTVSGKSWQQILVMRGDFPIDPSPGWQKILEWIYHGFGGNAESLVIFSVVALMWLVMLGGLPWFRRPEAWLAALFIAAIFIPACPSRFARGRPFLLTEAVLITILFLWSHQEKDWPKRVAIIFTPLLVAASAWIHGAWYLLCLPGAAILLAGLWRSAICYGACWLGGSWLGCAFTGHPFGFLFQSVRHMFSVFENASVNSQIATELQPSDGDISAVLIVAVLLLWRKIFIQRNLRTLVNPIFLMMILGWLLGLKTQRFWWDFGLPAFIIWSALELQDHFEHHLDFASGKRFLITLGIAAGAYFGFTADLNNRWTTQPPTQYISANNPALAGWLPAPDGILYDSGMDIFFPTFFENPTADWRYVLGFEAGLMRPDDLKILRTIEATDGDARAYELWVEKMRPQDRMVLRSNGAPPIRELEWHHLGDDWWIGRLPQTNADATSK